MKYAIETIRVNSDWFDKGNNAFKKIKEDGLELYLALFKWRVHQGSYYTHQFSTCIYYLAKDLKWGKQKVFDTLAILKRNKVISVGDYEWRLLYKEGINDRLSLHIVAIDVPTEYSQKQISHYIHIPMAMVEEYQNRKLSYKHFALYCLAVKWSHTPDGFFMNYETIADVLGYDKKTVIQMALELNRQQLLFTQKKKNDKGGDKCIHFIVRDMKEQEDLIKTYGQNSQKYLEGYNKRRPRKKGKLEPRNKMVEDNIIDEEEDFCLVAGQEATCDDIFADIDESSIAPYIR